MIAVDYDNPANVPNEEGFVRLIPRTLQGIFAWAKNNQIIDLSPAGLSKETGFLESWGVFNGQSNNLTRDFCYRQIVA